jgi:hypothetical protein
MGIDKRIFQLQHFLILALTCSLFACLAAAKIIDPGSSGPDAKFLVTLEDVLEPLEVDVALGATTALPLSGRPRLASLGGYVPHQKDWGSFSKRAWEYAFAEGMAGIIFAAQPNPIPPKLAEAKAMCDASQAADIEGCQFITDWLSADPEKRVFVAFTRNDFPAAKKVQQALQKSGFVAFLFLKGQFESPWAEPSVVGEVFAQAARRLVIDTESARSSEGVKFESLCCAPLLMGEYPSTPWSTLLARPR